MNDPPDNQDSPTDDASTQGADERTLDASAPPPAADKTVALDTVTAGAFGGLPAGDLPAIEGYTLDGKLGEEGQGTVWRGVQLSTNRRVAIKCLKAGAFSSPKAIARFEREVELSARLDHPHIVRVYDSGIRRGVYFYAMELVDGAAMDEYVLEHRLSQRQILELMRLVCLAVQHAHQRGVIHRDLKPSNILVDPRGQPHILDFGLAKTFLDTDADLRVSREGDAPGTIPYMSPEQAAGHADSLDTRTDVYSLGVNLYRLLLGRFPRDMAGTAHEVRHRIATEDIRRPRAVGKRFNAELEALLLKALDRDPDRRYPSAGEMAADLDNFLHGRPLAAKAPTAIYVLGKYVHRYRLQLSLAGIVLLAMATLAVLSYVRVVREQQNTAREAEAARRSLYFNRVTLADSEHRHAETARVGQLLDLCPEDLRGWEWRRMKTVFDRSAMTIPAHEDAVFAVGVCDGGRRIYSTGKDGTVRWWDAITGAPLQSVRGHEGPVNGAATDAAGAALYTCGKDGWIRFWDAAHGTPAGEVRVAVLAPPAPGATQPTPVPAELNALAASPDGQMLIYGCEDGNVGLLRGPEHRNGLLSGPPRDAPDAPPAMNMAANDGRHATQRPAFAHAHASAVLAVACDSRGNLVASSAGAEILLWDARSGALKAQLLPGTRMVACLAFSDDGKYLAAGGDDAKIRLWDLQAKQGLTPLSASLPLRKMGSVPALPDAERILEGHTKLVAAVAFLPGSDRLASASWDYSIRLWDVQSGAEVDRLYGHPGKLSTLSAWPGGGKLVSGGFDKQVRVWDLDVPSPDRVFRGHADTVLSAALTAQGKLLSCGPETETGPQKSDATLRAWDLATGRPAGDFKAADKSRGAFRIALSPDHKRVATAGGDGSVRIWDAESGAELKVLPGHDKPVLWVDFDPAGRRVVSASVDGTMRVIDLESAAPPIVISPQAGRINCARFSPDGRTIASAGADGLLRLWDAASGQPKGVLGRHDGKANCLAFRPDGKVIASGGTDAVVRLWDATGLREIKTLKGHTGGVQSVEFSPAEARLVSASDDKTLRLWDSQTGDEALILHGHTGIVYSAAFSPDGRSIISAGADKTVRVWDSTRAKITRP